MNNPLSFSSLKLDLFSKDGVRVNSASGFVVDAGNRYYLITSRHVLSGRDISSGEQQTTMIEPYLLKTSLHIHGGEGENSFPLFPGIRKRTTVQLYDDNN